MMFIIFFIGIHSVNAEKSNVNFVITDVEPKVLHIGEDEFLNITLKNLGTDYALQVEAEISQNSYIVPLGPSILYTKKARGAFESSEYFGAVLQNEEIKLSFFVHVNDVEPGSYVIPVKVSYRNPNMDKEEKILYVGLKLVGKPKIILAGLNTSPQLIYPDSDFLLEVLIENIGKDTAKGVELELIMPKYFSGERRAFVGSLESDRRAKAVFNLKTSKNIKSGLYNFTLIIKYWYENTVFKEISYFEIYVTEKERPKLEISSVDASPERAEKLYPGTTFTLSVQFENIGKQTAKSIKAILRYPKEFSGDKISFLGSLEQDDTATAIYDLKISEKALSGSYTFEVLLEYYDELGNLYKDKKEFVLYVEPKKNILSYLIVILIALLLIFLAYKIKRGRE